ncbi:hypothetical protein [Enhygromyxa salina]|uniref:Uncharacterized protein n=1 Tax=Enhygromyxa salina TaxID=215803 RepID=A0A2S9YIL4_9BACT|nr:hypothetical protein [Enhygromyxa salina]PRQ04910.1 hypothetical protein ENSA7_48410 [Enhygromyxa salina]
MRTHGTGLFIAALIAVVGVDTLGCERGRSTDRPEADDPAELASALAEVTATGREIHRRDMFAWWASDAAVPQLTAADAEVLRGWVLDADDPSLVHFVAELDGGPHSLLRVRCSEASACTVERPAEPPPLSERNAAQQRAVATASQHPSFEPTSERYNHVVVPTADSRWAVYMIAATVDPNLAMLGRHYQFLVSADGAQVVDWRAFSKTALALELRPAGMPEGASLEALVVTHLLDPIPTELHVWVALNYRIKLAVMTGSSAHWMIDVDGSVTRAE